MFEEKKFSKDDILITNQNLSKLYSNSNQYRYINGYENNYREVYDDYKTTLLQKNQRKLNITIDLDKNTKLNEIELDPNTPIDPKLMKYYISFYNAFIDPYGPITVNLSARVAKDIYQNLKYKPTIGIFDEVKKKK